MVELEEGVREKVQLSNKITHDYEFFCQFCWKIMNFCRRKFFDSSAMDDRTTHLCDLYQEFLL